MGLGLLLVMTSCEEGGQNGQVTCEGGLMPICLEDLACQDGSAPFCPEDQACDDGNQPICVDENVISGYSPHGDMGLLEDRTPVARTDKTMPIPDSVEMADMEIDDNGTCTTGCHMGIEEIGSELNVHAGFNCTSCHKGDSSAPSADGAHAGLLPDPGDMRLLLDGDPTTQVCGGCHGNEDETENSHVTRMRKSLHATSAGVISGTRYAWGLDAKGDIRYATWAVEDLDGDVGGLALLEQVPQYDPNSMPGAAAANDYLRNQCLRCHVWGPGATRAGDYRGTGCTSCHMLYTDEGVTATGDPTVPVEPGHMYKHVLTKRIPSQQCIHCHNRGGRTGPSYIGTIESDDYGSPWTPTGGKQATLHGKSYNHLDPDIHWERGLECIDCHFSDELHGDGNIYGKKEEAVFIECQSCHGSFTEASVLEDRRGQPLPNVTRDPGSGVITLTSLFSGVEHEVTEASSVDAVAMNIPGHQQKLECYACHSTWAPQCYGCHAIQDISTPNRDNLAAIDGSGIQSAGSWSESRSYVRWEEPILGINADGKVSPFVTGCQVFFTQRDGQTPISNNITHTTMDGHSGLSHNPIHPHTVRPKPRPCASCHLNPKAWGIGSGEYRIADNFPPEPAGNVKAEGEVYGGDLQFELEQIVSTEGVQLQGTSHVGARPFDLLELHKISKEGTCEMCHRNQ